MTKAVFVTGAASGTGYAIAERFAREGYAVVIISREQSRADEAAEKSPLSMVFLPEGMHWIFGMKNGSRLSLRTWTKPIILPKPLF